MSPLWGMLNPAASILDLIISSSYLSARGLEGQPELFLHYKRQATETFIFNNSKWTLALIIRDRLNKGFRTPEISVKGLWSWSFNPIKRV